MGAEPPLSGGLGAEPPNIVSEQKILAEGQCFFASFFTKKKWGCGGKAPTLALYTRAQKLHTKPPAGVAGVLGGRAP